LPALFFWEEDQMEEGTQEIVPGCNRGLHVRRRRHNYFAKARREVFLEHLAATCNVTASAAAAGISVSAVYVHRMKDPEFRALWGDAIEQGYARLEAALIERAARAEERIRLRGDKEVSGPDAPAEIDWDKAMQLLRHHQRGLAGRTPDNRARPLRVPIEALAAKLIKRMRALGVRPPEEGAGP
jgi:hypothetical protein